MTDWKKYKGRGAWQFKEQSNKPNYNEGSFISDAKNPVWLMKGFSGSPITLRHAPCGYWHKHYTSLYEAISLYCITNYNNSAFGLADSVDCSFIQPFQLHKPWKSWSPAEYHALYLRNDGFLFAAGDAEYVGGSWNAEADFIVPNYKEFVSQSLEPVDLGPWKSIDATLFHFKGILENGTLWSSGWNRDNWGTLGRGPVGDVSLDLGQIGTDTDWETVCGAGKWYCHAIKSNRQLYAWGFNGGGELGLGDLVDRHYPELALSYCDYCFGSAISGGTVAIANGLLYGTGRNNYGQLGIGEPFTYATTFTESPFFSNLSKAVITGDNGMFLTSDGDVYVVGYGGTSEWSLLGLGDQLTRKTPEQVPNIKAKDIATSGHQMYCLDTEGELYWTGLNMYGNGPFSNQLKTFTHVSGGPWDSIEGYWENLILKKKVIIGG